MKIQPINCPNCGAAIKIESKESLVHCTHCETSAMIEWPESTQRHYVMKSPSSPIVTCPACSAQQFRTDEQAGESIACYQCGEESIMPEIVGHQLKVCGTCGRNYFSYELFCPDSDRHPPR